MVLDFDVKTFCQNLRATKPPYECPVKSCGKIYKSFCGIQFHLYNYDHENPTSQQPTPKMKRKKGRWHPRQNRRSPSPDISSQLPPDGLRYTEQQKMVEVDLDGHVHQLNVCEPLDIVFYEGPVNDIKKEVKVEDAPKKPEKTPKTNKSSSTTKNRKDTTVTKEVKLPEAKFRVIPDYEAPNAPPMPIAYFRFIEKSAEELDEDVEYDMDEEDCAWLDLMNEKRNKENIGEITADTFELLMDRLEKESYFQSQTSGKDPNPSIDEDAVCCICNDGECQNSNAILFCDMCNLAVHQECYGVPYIPEGQWLCRRCLQSPSRAVDCVLCPNKGGAFKQTDDGRWAHVVCALWIPEVCFANTVFLEPLDNIENIPPARWKLTCYICKQRSVGACIQCHKANCYTAFHVTCAQQAGLHMKMEAVRENGINGTSYNVRKTAYCDVHAPADADNTADEESGRTDSFKKAKAKAKSREKMRKARKILAEKRSAVPVVSLPTIPPDRLTKISSMVSMAKKHQFLERLVAYWTLKRQSRNGVPLLRRLQTTNQTRRDPEFDKNCGSLGEQLKYWQRLRQDLEKARLLVELIRKREKLKREYVRADELVTEMQLQPLIVKLREIVSQLNEKDLALGEIFAKPVDLVEVPDYLDYIKHPMDLQTIMTKVNTYSYDDFDSFEDDFNLMIKNCLTYNSKDTVFYKAALKMREQGGALLREARTFIDLAGFDFKTGLLLKREEAEEEKHETPNVRAKSSGASNQDKESVSFAEQLKALQNKLTATEKMKPGVSRSRRAKHLRTEIVKLKRKIAIQQAIGRRKKRKLLNEKALEINSETLKDPPNSKVNTPNLSRTRHNHKKSDDSNNVSNANVAVTPSLPSKRTTRATQAETQVKTSQAEGGTKNKTVITPPVPSRSNKSSASASEGKEEIRRPVGRPPRKCPKYFKKASPPPPSLSQPNGPDKSTSSSPPTLVSASNSDSTKATKSTSRAISPPSSSSKGISPPILKPQVPFVNTDGLESNSSKPSSSLTKSGDSTSPMRTSSRIRSLRSVTQMPKGKVVEVDLGTEDEEQQQAEEVGVKEVETRSKSSRSQSRSQSESDAGSPSRKSLRKIRSSSIAGDGEAGPSKKRVSNTSSVSANSNSFSVVSVPQTDSFKVYRSSSQDHATDSDNNTETTSESIRSSSGSSSESSDDDESEAGDGLQKTQASGGSSSSRRLSRHSHTSEWNAEEQQHLIPLQPLDLVWAKCRGYPWYPALIISPDMPNSGYFHNGVPIPVPPKEVLALKENYTEDVFLVLFFDTKRTWQWLPRDKLAPLGVDSTLDKARLVEPKKTAERKAVKKAFENAILHRCRVTGESNSISGDSGNDN